MRRFIVTAFRCVIRDRLKFSPLASRSRLLLVMPEWTGMGEESQNLELCVCVPARNEAKRLPILLSALAAQDWPVPVRIVIAVNNSQDASLEAIAQAQRLHEGRIDVHTLDVTFPEELAHAGSARRCAMDAGLALLGDPSRGVLVSTDADTRPPPRWLANIVAALRRGADMVGGKIIIEDNEALPGPVSRLRSAWDRYWETVRKIEDALDPVAWDAPPRHGDHTGASLAIRADLYVRCGGVPLLKTGEDQALVNAALSKGARLAHPLNVYTFVSPRREGRASGGMAAAMNELFELAGKGEKPLAPAFEHWRERALWRRHLRAMPGGAERIAAEEPFLAPMPHDMVLELSP
ncbi:glycosyltransferase family A protein [Novosphingobium sp. PhB57]|jgi:glycosyltransferase involved in cell wall biosynthesis|uniref:glycosyltransferase family 2 protein n=1 Tax=Novosphingobium sp. PhB57 TaxID=2485107 RepID=UPI003260DC4E